MNSKPFYLSGTIISAAVSGLAQLASFFHLNISDLIPQITAAIGDQVNATLAIAGVVGAIYGRFRARAVIKPLSTASKPLKMLLVLASVSALSLTACATSQIQETETIAGDILSDVTTGAVAVSDAETALSAAQQAMGGHGVSVANIGTYAAVEAGAANTSGLTTAVQTLTGDIETQLADGATPATITPQLTAAQLAVSAAAPALSPADTTTSN